MKKNVLFFFIPILVVLNSILAYNNTPIVDGFRGISPDSLDYIKIAEDLPFIKSSLFPIFYPFCIKTFSFFTQNYLLTTKIICGLSLVFSFGFVYYKQWYWKEIWTILATASFLDIYYWSWSETIIIPTLLLCLYYISQYFNGKKSKFWIIKLSALFIIMLLTKYSIVFLLAGIFIWVVLKYIFSKEKYFKLLIPVVISAIVFVFYLFLNYYFTGYFTGKRLVRPTESINIQLSIYNIIFSFNPFINARFFGGYKINYIALTLFTLLLFIPFLVQIFKEKFKNSEVFFYIFISAIFGVLSYVAFFITKLDYLNERLLLPSIFFFYIAVIKLHSTQIEISSKKLITIAYLSLIINISDNIIKNI